MTRRKTNDLTMKETFINNMIQDSIEHDKGFDPNLISNGEITFNDFIGYINYKNLKMEFYQFIELKKKTLDEMFTIPKELKKKYYYRADDLPFAEDFKDEK
jgi:hypothetical protein